MPNVLPARRLPLLQRHPAPQPEPFSVESLESEIRDAATSVGEQRAIPPEVEKFAPKAPLPTYVEHAADVSSVGRITAEAVVTQYEAAAKEIEAMAADLIEMQKRVEAESAVVHKVIRELIDTAAEARAEGKRAFDSIERMSKMTETVRAACADIRLKLAPQ